MSDTLNLTPRSADHGTPRSTKTTPGTSSKQNRDATSLKKGGTSPVVRESPGQPENALLPSSPRQDSGYSQPASPRATRLAADSPYKPSSSKAGAPASPRAYLESLKSDNLAKGILRDQTTANAAYYPTAFIDQVQASLNEPVTGLREMMHVHLARMSDAAIERLYPTPGCDERFDWQPFEKLCDVLWHHFSGAVLSLKRLPLQTVGLLADLRAELALLPAFDRLEPDARNKTVSDALFNLLIWNGIINALTKSVPFQQQRLAQGFGAFVKAAWGMQAQSQGGISTAIASMVHDRQLSRCADFRAALTPHVERIAALRDVSFQDDHVDHALNNLREQNIERHFTATWANRNDDHDEVVRIGSYFLVDDKGNETRCTSYRKLKKFVGDGARNSLPEVVLHVAGDRIHNFLCNTYLYHLKNPLFTDARGRRVEPVPSLKTTFVLRRDDSQSGKITVRFSCTDPAVESVMLDGHHGDGMDYEARPIFPASLQFHGELHFYQNEEFEAGNIVVTGQNFHLLE